MTEFQLLPNGDISGYKTDFVKALVNDTSKDKVYMRYVGATLVAFCIESEGHICNICKNKVHKFVEMSIKAKIVICQDCFKQIYQNFEDII